jgi:hypothetical protein
MQKVQSYLYPNRVILLADLAGFTVENKVVYAKTIKIYQGVDNVIEFDIQNVDQKRLDLTTLSNLKVNIMDAGGKALVNSPYSMNLVTSATATGATVNATTGQATTTTITVPTANISGNGFAVGYLITGTSIKGTVTVSSISADIDSSTTTITVTFAKQTVSIATGVAISNVVMGLAKITIPIADLSGLSDQFLIYSATALNSSNNTVMLYNDSQFGGSGTMQFITKASPQTRSPVIHDEFASEINYMGNVITHTSAIPCKFYEAQATSSMNFQVNLSGFIGTVYVEATEDMTIAVSSWLNSPKLQAFTCATATTQTITFNNVPVLNPTTGKNYSYMRVSWYYPDVWSYGSQQNAAAVYGSITKVIAS